MTVISAARRRRLPAILFAVVLALGAAGTAASPASAHPDPHGLTDAQREVLWEATHQFRDVKEALAAGYVPTEDCVPNMGFHYGHPELLADGDIDPVLPEILVYEPAEDGSVRLVALEYFRADADGDTGTDDDRPTLFGHGFDGPMEGHPVPPGEPPMPVHYDLHVWLYKDNPDGELTAENPDVVCPEATPES